MSEFTLALAMVAPYYNLAMVIVAIWLFIVLFRIRRKNEAVYIKPWYYIFMGLMVFTIEELITVLRALGWIIIPRHINGFFEIVIVSLFIYAVLLQKDYLKKTYKKS